jgi:hypothetical protein
LQPKAGSIGWQSANQTKQVIGQQTSAMESHATLQMTKHLLLSNAVIERGQFDPLPTVNNTANFASPHRIGDTVFPQQE